MVAFQSWKIDEYRKNVDDMIIAKLKKEAIERINEERLQQEEKDRKLAIKLQTEINMNKEEESGKSDDAKLDDVNSDDVKFDDAKSDDVKSG